MAHDTTTTATACSLGEHPDSSLLSIDQEEFARLQSQLLKLREDNYVLREDIAKRDAEISGLQVQSRELEKARKVIQKSKKGKEVQALIEENERLQIKIEVQEQEFKLQNITIMDELSMVSMSKNELEKEVSHLKSVVNHGGEHQVAGDEKVLKLQAEIAALRSMVESENSSEEIQPECEDTMQFQTIAEENKLLYGQLATVKDTFQSEIEKLKMNNAELVDKLRRKQESILQLQKEKESLFIQKQEAGKEAMKVYEAQVEMLTRQLADMQGRLDTFEQGNSLRLSEETSSITDDFRKTREENDQLRLQISSHEHEKEQFESDVKELEGRITSLTVRATEAEELADKRRQTINEMSTKGHEKDQEYRSKLNKMKEQWKNDVEHFKKDLETAMESKNQLETEKEVLNNELSVREDLKNSFASLNQKLEEEKKQWKAEKASLIEDREALREELQEEIVALTNELCQEKEAFQCLSQQCEEYEQMLKDKDHEVAIAERKCINQMKDLKRQVQQLQKKEEKLQHQLTEFKIWRGDSSVVGATNEQKRQHSRESSYSSIKGILQDTPDPNIHGSNSGEVSPLDGDTKDLLARITTLQSGKWALEARVNHLEQSNAALAEDLLQKTAVIQHYFVANKADHSEPLKEPSSSPETSRSALSPSKIMQRITGSKSSEVDHLKDVVGKLQRSLEEALMKNIHLQQSMDVILKEMEALKEQEKLRSPPQLQCASDP